MVANTQNGFLKARGLPFDTTLEKIQDWFEGFGIVQDGVWRAYYRDRPDGQCFVVFKDANEAQAAFNALDRKEMGTRYIELFTITLNDFQLFLYKNRKNLINDIDVKFDESYQPPP